MDRYLVVGLACFVAIVLSGCGERDQTVSYNDGKFRGKPDDRPWESQPPPYVLGVCSLGYKYGWHKHLRARNDGQNENRRIGQ